MVFTTFNVEYSKDCIAKDYLYIGRLAKYNKVGIDILWGHLNRNL